MQPRPLPLVLFWAQLGHSPLGVLPHATKHDHETRRDLVLINFIIVIIMS